ncbi:MAG: hypothetical protein NTU81_02575 [Candidatus Nomurabacteria bacterium]|nr:hypothetical protein [Candidatus Nomurabacteria bacterium]
MARTFLPKDVVLSKEVIGRLKKDYRLSDDDTLNIEYWNHIHSPYTGVIIVTDEEIEFNCYPYEKMFSDFISECPEGLIWK